MGCWQLHNECDGYKVIGLFLMLSRLTNPMYHLIVRRRSGLSPDINLSLISFMALTPVTTLKGPSESGYLQGPERVQGSALRQVLLAHKRLFDRDSLCFKPFSLWDG